MEKTACQERARDRASLQETWVFAQDPGHDAAGTCFTGDTDDMGDAGDVQLPYEQSELKRACADGALRARA
ncbi:hypothetical protein [Streptomyces sp. NPDC058620]|uniref:hypothetical protein n=1 Tax=Streptomyces sp. NPDC058620 TaxID=3346560 RepID=UPI0036652EA4